MAWASCVSSSCPPTEGLDRSGSAPSPRPVRRPAPPGWVDHSVGAAIWNAFGGGGLYAISPSVARLRLVAAADRWASTPCSSMLRVSCRASCMCSAAAALPRSSSGVLAVLLRHVVACPPPPPRSACACSAWLSGSSRRLPHLVCVRRPPALVWWCVSGPAHCGLGDSHKLGQLVSEALGGCGGGLFGYRGLLPLPGRHGWPEGCFGRGRVEGEGLRCPSVSGMFVCICLSLCRARGWGVRATGLPGWLLLDSASLCFPLLRAFCLRVCGDCFVLGFCRSLVAGALPSRSAGSAVAPWLHMLWLLRVLLRELDQSASHSRLGFSPLCSC